MGEVAERFAEWFAPVRRDIFKCCEALNFKPTQQQSELLGHIQAGVRGTGSPRIAVASGQGCGKSAAMGAAAVWLAIRNEGALIPVTAPSMKQCFTWREELERTLGRADACMQRLFEITRTRVIVMGDHKWGIRFVTASRPETAQGIHGEHMSILVDEASGVSNALLEQWFGTQSNTRKPGNNPIFLLAGNPNSRDCFFFRCFNDLRHLFATQRMNAEESPIVGPERNRLIAEMFGIDSDAYRVRVLGEFPRVDPQSVMSSEDLECCWDQSWMLRRVRASNVKQFGIDLSRFGGDESVIYRRSGDAIVEKWVGSKVEPGHVINRAFRMQLEAGWDNQSCLYVPDATGMGQGILSQLYDAGKRVFEFHNGSASTVPDYENKVTEAYFRFAARVKRHEVLIPKDQRLVQQLSNRKYLTTKKGKLVLESKDDYMKRGFDSPDRADACVQAFWGQAVSKSTIATGGRSSVVGANKLEAA